MSPSPKLDRRRRIFGFLGMAAVLGLVLACGGVPALVATPTPEVPTERPKPTSRPRPTATVPAEPTAMPAEPTVAPVADLALLSVTFSRGLAEDQSPIDPTEAFYPTDVVHLVLEFAGQPAQGVFAATFSWREQQLATAEVDLADLGAGTAEQTYVSFTLDHEQPLAIDGEYYVDVTLDGEPFDSYTFEVAPSPGDLTATIDEIVLARDVTDDYQPIDPTTNFAADERVYIIGSGDFPVGSLLRTVWTWGAGETETYVIGPYTEALEDNSFWFYFKPEEDWTDGAYEVSLYLNGEFYDSYGFTIGGAQPLGEVVIGDLVAYEAPTGVFRIEVPENWTFDDASGDPQLLMSWEDPVGFAGVLVAMYNNPDTMSPEDLELYGEQFIATVLSESGQYEIVDRGVQDDGSFLLVWRAAVDHRGTQVAARGLTYAEQRGDKLSVLTLIAEEDQLEALWEAGLGTVINSYKIDPAQPLLP